MIVEIGRKGLLRLKGVVVGEELAVYVADVDSEKMLVDGDNQLHVHYPRRKIPTTCGIWTRPLVRGTPITTAAKPLDIAKR